MRIFNRKFNHFVQYTVSTQSAPAAVIIVPTSQMKKWRVEIFSDPPEVIKKVPEPSWAPTSVALLHS